MKIVNTDAITGLQKLHDESVDCCITSPPYYGLRDYGCDGQIGLEQTPNEYIENLVSVFHEVRRVLKRNGTLWIVIGDCYAGSGKGAALYPDNVKKYKQGTNRGMIGAVATTKIETPGLKSKDLIGVPWTLAFALRSDGWYLRQDIIWNKPNAMPESVKDRCTKSHEYVFLLSKSQHYYYDAEAIREPAKYDGRKDIFHKGANKYTRVDDLPETYSKPHERWKFKNGIALKNKRDVWNVCTKAYKGAHFAVFPEELITPCVLAGCPAGGTVLDPFAGSGTTGKVALDNGRDAVLIELNSDYCQLCRERCDPKDEH